MPSWPKAYDERLEEARRILRDVVERNKARLIDSYVSFLIELDRILPSGGTIDEENIPDVLNRIGRLFAAYSIELEAEVRRQVQTLLDTAVEGHRAGTEAAATAAGVAVDLVVFVGISSGIIEIVGRRRPETIATSIGGGPVPPGSAASSMIRSNAEAARQGVDDFIRRAQGRPYRDAAREMLDLMSQDPDVRRAIATLDARGEAVRRSIVRQGRALTQLRNPSKNFYQNAKRVYVHEQNSMFHEADALASHRSPIVDLLKWHTSARHDTLETAPDICDVLEDQDLHDFGPGVYFPATLPSLPHPYCEDFTTKIYREPKDWGRPKRTPTEPPEVGEEAIERLLKSREKGKSPTLTENRLTAITKHANRSWSVAHDAFVDF